MALRSVLLTGATGHSGQAVLRELVRNGFEVTALVRKPASIEGCRTVVSELARADGVAQEVAGADAIVHLASPREFDRESALRDDILGMSHLIAAWRRAGPFIYVSSPTVHRWWPAAITETGPIDLSNWYDFQKFTNEFQLKLAVASGPGSGVSLRPGFFFGSSQRRDGRQFFNDVYQHCRLGGKFVLETEEAADVYGSSFIGLKDFGRAVCAALSIGVSGPYNVAGGFCTWKDLIAAMNRCAGTRAELVVRPQARPEAGEFRLFQSRTYLDTDAFQKQTGFVPQQMLEELIQELITSEATAADSKV